MLLAMYFNGIYSTYSITPVRPKLTGKGYIIISILLGAFVGHFLFGYENITIGRVSITHHPLTSADWNIENRGKQETGMSCC
jgi:hypothetical protein